MSNLQVAFYIVRNLPSHTFALFDLTVVNVLLNLGVEHFTEHWLGFTQVSVCCQPREGFTSTYLCWYSAGFAGRTP